MLRDRIFSHENLSSAWRVAHLAASVSNLERILPHHLASRKAKHNDPGRMHSRYDFVAADMIKRMYLGSECGLFMVGHPAYPLSCNRGGCLSLHELYDGLVQVIIYEQMQIVDASFVAHLLIVCFYLVFWRTVRR